MRLAREHDAHGSVRVGDEPLEPVEVREEEAGALVRRKTAGEADRQHVLLGSHGPAAASLAGDPEELSLAERMDPPELLVGEVAGA